MSKIEPPKPAYMRLKAAAAYLSVSVRYFQLHVNVKPKELPGRGKKPMLLWSIAELDAWVERVSDPKSRERKRPAAPARVSGGAE